MATRLSILFTGGLLIISGYLAGQPYLIQGNIEYADQGKIYLASYYGDRFSITDSIENSGGSFLFMFPEETPAGIFRLIYPEVYQGVRTENRFVEFIYNHGDVSFSVTGGETDLLPHFENSLENQVYLEFMTFHLDYEADLMETYGKLVPAMPGDPGYEAAVDRYEELQNNRIRYMDSITLLYPELYATKIMNAFRVPVVRGSVPHRERIEALKRLYFKGASIDDPTLLHAPVYTFRIVDYLSLFRVDTLSREQQEQQFIEAVDQIMVNTAPDPEIRSFMVEFMLEGFELLGMEVVQLYLAEHYLDESCESDVVELVLSRMEGTKKLGEGRIAPDFVIRDMQGKTHRLSELSNPYVLVMFWASTCIHCQEMIPELHDWYVQENNLDLEVVAISIDSTESQFKQFTEDAGMQWITTHDHLGWHGKVPGDYHIYATPSLFLLDRERVILSRPLNFRQFQRAIKKLGQDRQKVTGPDSG